MKSPLLFTKKTIIIASVIVVIIIGIVIVGLIRVHNNSTHSTNNAVGSKSSDTPTYHTILPGNKSIDQLNGWTRISPPNNDPVYAYADTINTTAINVSEQPIPLAFKSDLTNKVAELAKTYNATSQFDTDNTKVYIGSSAKGPQSVIFVKDNVLILIKSQQKIDNKDWQKYIESLS